MDPGDLRNKIQVHTKQLLQNELMEEEYVYAPLKYVWGQIVPKGNKLGYGQSETEYAESTHRIRVRAQSLPDIDNTYKMEYRGQIYEVLYFDFDYKRGEFLDIQVRLKTE
ncbi:phage head-tail joining protein [Andreesenia angusta]|uniref:Phage head-tail joining protein n=1 Tax=Andreesenia angusta TaxID=39480 RepID=A0A1S1V8H0_9FIRM|nr:head-tail adaptor protein [Andreesenia angusta]OHW62911.1 phage head-tail joining protein [Andreesenia angusta]